MNTATVTPAVQRFLNTFSSNYQDAPPAPKPTLPQPPNHRCPHCGSKLEPEEVKANECWACLTPLKSDSDTGIND
jgi:rRNA maturation endonuclease Nob1